MTAATHGWVRVEREVRPRNGLGLIHLPTCLNFCATEGERRIALGMKEDRAPCYAPKQRMTTAETWATRRKVGHDVAAEESRNVGQAVPSEIEKDEGG